MIAVDGVAIDIPVALIGAAGVVLVAIIGGLVGLAGHMLVAQGKRIDQLDAKVRALEERIGVADRRLSLACRHIERLHDHHCDPEQHPYPELPEELRGHVDPTVWRNAPCGHPVPPAS